MVIEHDIVVESGQSGLSQPDSPICFNAYLERDKLVNKSRVDGVYFAAISKCGAILSSWENATLNMDRSVEWQLLVEARAKAKHRSEVRYFDGLGSLLCKRSQAREDALNSEATALLCEEGLKNSRSISVDLENIAKQAEERFVAVGDPLFVKHKDEMVQIDQAYNSGMLLLKTTKREKAWILIESKHRLESYGLASACRARLDQVDLKQSLEGRSVIKDDCGNWQMSAIHQKRWDNLYVKIDEAFDLLLRGQVAEQRELAIKINKKGWLVCLGAKIRCLFS